MKKADPNCDQCNGRGWDGKRFGDGDIGWCHCLKEEPHRDNPALNWEEIIEGLPQKLKDNYVEEPNPNCYGDGFIRDCSGKIESACHCKPRPSNA